MGNWPSVNSDISDGSLSIDESDDDSSSNKDERDRGEDEAGDLCGSEKSFFSEEELIPLDAQATAAQAGSVSTSDMLTSEDDGDFSEFTSTLPGISGLPIQSEIQAAEESSYQAGCTLHRLSDAKCDAHIRDEEEGDDDNGIDDDDYDGDNYASSDDVDDDAYRVTSNDKIGDDMFSSAFMDEDSNGPSSLPLPPPPSPFSSELTQESVVPQETLKEDESPGLKGSPSHEPVMAWEIDVSDMIGPKKTKKQLSSNLSKVKSKTSASKASRDSAYVPPSFSTTPELLAHRKCLDQRRWFCISRPQYSKSCGLSSLVSSWNYLFSSLGGGSLPPITQEQALTVLGFQPPFGEIRFGPFTGNATLMRWFKQLNDHYGVRGRAYYQYKPHGRGRTVGRTQEEGLHLLKQGLQDPNMAFIYHCYNHYFCPIGFEDVPLKAVDAYRDPLNQEEVETWILIGDTSRKHPGIHCFKWEDISTDLNCQNPEYLNIRKLQLGVQRRKTKKTGGNLHCIMAFCRSAGFLTAKTRKGGVPRQGKETVGGSKGGSRKGGKNGSSKTGERSGRGTAGSENKSRLESKSAPCLVAEGDENEAKENVEDAMVSQSCDVRETKSDMRLRKVGSGTKSVSKKKLKTSENQEDGRGPEGQGLLGPKEDVHKKKKKKVKRQKSGGTSSRETLVPDDDEGRRLEQVRVETTSLGEVDCCEAPVSLSAPERETSWRKGGDAVERFLQDFSTQDPAQVPGIGAREEAAMRAALINKQHSALSVEHTHTSPEEWVLLGQSADKESMATQMPAGDINMSLSDFRRMDGDKITTADDVRNWDRQEGEVSEMAKQLIEQYLVSIVDSLSLDKDKTVPTADQK